MSDDWRVKFLILCENTIGRNIASREAPFPFCASFGVRTRPRVAFNNKLRERKRCEDDPHSMRNFATWFSLLAATPPVTPDRRARTARPTCDHAFIGRARHAACSPWRVRAGFKLSAPVRNKIATENVTIVPKQIHHGKFHPRARSARVKVHRRTRAGDFCTRLATTMMPRIMAIMLPVAASRSREHAETERRRAVRRRCNRGCRARSG